MAEVRGISEKLIHHSITLTSHLPMQAPTQEDSRSHQDEDDGYSSNESESSEIDFSESETSDEDSSIWNRPFEVPNSDTGISKIQDLIEQQWLTHEHCDFLSDFGRCEPFLLDGDALMMNALSNKYLDWRNGGQFLHLIYIVEQFLSLLWSRGAHFEIFFRA